MRKQEYIEKYGEDAYQKLLAQYKKYRESHKAERSNYVKEYYQRNKDILSEKNKIRQKNSRESINVQRKKHYRTINGRAVGLAEGYRKKDKKRGFNIENNIDAKWIIENILNSKCIYCGDKEWEHLGADRIDNNKPHIPSNCVCSCWLCNAERSDQYTVEGFKQYRALHPRECDIPKAPAIIVGENGALKKRTI